MRLADFIEREQEQILREWESFARRLTPAADAMSALALRDHAPEILDAIARDLRTGQTSLERAEKAQGRARQRPNAPETAAQTHAVLRARDGFDIKQLVAEYRALRASVLRLWTDTRPSDSTAFDDMLRFNEAIDQAVAESVAFFHRAVEQAHSQLVGVLGRGMRGPLDAILSTASTLALLNAGTTVSAAAHRVQRSGASLTALLDNLVDFSCLRLGLGLRIDPSPLDLSAVVRNEVEQLRGAYPRRVIDFRVAGEWHGRWDGPRMQQLVRNLVSNALQYGAVAEPVQVDIQAAGDDICLQVTNRGDAIRPADRSELFAPLKRGTTSGEGLGLGLFIVGAITVAHGGDVACSCDEGETVFRVRLPRVAEATVSRATWDVSHAGL